MIATLAFALLSAHARMPAPRYVRLHLEVVAYGVLGTGTLDVDRATGRFARHFAAGPASEGEGFDGTRAWRSDATGMARIEGNVDERGEIAGWSAAFTRALREPLNVSVVHSGTDRDEIRFSGYRRAGDLWIPSHIESHSDENGVWHASLTGVDTPAWEPPSAFAPPPPPHDARLRGVTRIPISMSGGSPMLEVIVDGRPMRFYLDTGGQNVITDVAARRAGLSLSGGAVVAGGGPQVAPIRFARARSVRVGAAEMRGAPFIVLAADTLPPGADGIVGYELLARFAARLDMLHRSLALAPHARAFGSPVRPVSFAFLDRQPQVPGAIDDISGAFSIDTGSNLTAQLTSAVVRSHGLIARWHASVTAQAFGVGGRYAMYLVRAHRVRLGSAAIDGPFVSMSTHRRGTLSNPSIVANVGDGILRRWTLVFDYPGQTIDFRPGGDPLAGAFRDHSGIALIARKGELLAGEVFGGTPAAYAGIRSGAHITRVNGRAVRAADFSAVLALLRASPGARVRLFLDDGSTHVVVLRRYL